MVLKQMIRQLAAGFGLAMVVLVLAGCESTNTGGTFTNVAVPPPKPVTTELNVGDLVIVTLSGIETPPSPHEEKIKEDGTITLTYLGAIKASGRTPGELQRDIREQYIARGYYRETLNVTVRAQQRSFYVGGQVRSPSSYPYAEGMTVLKAIQSAGDFNEFAKRTKVQVTRADGRTLIVNCKKALTNPALDIPIYPGDSINVPRSL
jgi:protein involved in polysaccharide export with SLBB domain